MRWRIISVGKVRESFYREGVSEYLKRLKPYLHVELLEGFEEKISPQARGQEVISALARERDALLARTGDGDYVVALDPGGRRFSSEGLAAWLADLGRSGISQVSFIIGGANGLHPDLKKRADALISLSDMTFPHQMAVLILAEQLYRAVKIQRGEPYHK